MWRVTICHGSREVLYMMWRVTICMMVPEIEIDS